MSNMKKLDINSAVRMPSGYEIPLLGYGVSISSLLYQRDATLHTTADIDSTRFIKRELHR
jgi:pseudouridine-5'-phosphate glycosidase